MHSPLYYIEDNYNLSFILKSPSTESLVMSTYGQDCRSAAVAVARALVV